MIHPSRRRRVATGAALAAGAAAAGWAMLTGFQPVPAGEPGPLPGDPALARTVATMRPVPEPERLPRDALSLPTLRIQATIKLVTITDRTLPVPADPAVVGLSVTGARPCARRGTTLIAGHVVNHGVRGALWPLAAVTSGTRLHIHCPDGSLTTYVATGSPETVVKTNLDPGLDTTQGLHRLVLITCGGPVLATGHYRDNVVAEFTRAG